jgi:branched-chain amino acid transport system substrate-binding protein
MNVRRYVLIAGALLATGLLATVAAVASASSSAKPPIKIGVEMPNTGPLAVIGINEKNGIVLAARQINAKGGINGRKIALTVLDDQSNPTNAVTNTTKLVSDGNIAILGPNSGPLVAPSTAVTVRSNVLQFVGSASDIQGTTAGPTTFFWPPHIPVWSAAMACYAKKTLKATKIAGINSTDPAGLQAAEGLKIWAAKLGMQVVDMEAVDLTATDTSVQWTKIREAKPDVVANMITGALAGTSAKTARTLGVNVPMLGYQANAQPAVWRLGGTAGEGAVVATTFSGTDPTKQQELFAKTFMKNYGTSPDTYNAFGYDWMNVLAFALKKIKNPTQKSGLQIAKILETTEIPGAMMTYHFGKYQKTNPQESTTHTAVKVNDVVFMAVKDGNFVHTKTQPKCG